MEESKNAPIRIGLDIGITSVGWAVMTCDEKGEPTRILGLGSRIFDAAEVPKTGGSLAADRRAARSMRRRLRRKGERLRRLRALLKEYGVEEISFVGEDANLLRVKGLDELLSDNDFARILYLLCKNRGFKSTKRESKKAKDGDKASNDEGKLIASAEKNKALMRDKGYRTIGETIFKEYVEPFGEFEGRWRNRGDYLHVVYRADLEAELKFLFEKQREFGGKLASSGIETKYFEIFSSQRSYDMGPGKGSKYSAEYAVGTCMFEPDEERAPKASFSFEWSRALENLNNLSIISDGIARPLSDEERKMAMSAIRSKNDFSYYDLRKLLGLKDDDKFNISYPRMDKKSKAKLNEIENNTDLTEEAKEAQREKLIKGDFVKFERDQKNKFSMNKSREIEKALSEEHKDDRELIDRLAVALSHAKSEQKRREVFAKDFAFLTDEEVDKLIGIEGIEKFGSVSLKALAKIIPLLEEGKKYSEACEAVYGSHTLREAERSELLNTEAVYAVLDDIAVPVVKRAVSQTLKVINAIIRRYGSPIAVNVELARDLTRSHDERKDIEKRNNDRYNDNERIKDKIRKELGVEPKPIDIVKYRLYEEQNGKCIYSGKQIDLDRLCDGTSYQVDHIMPFSRTFNDSYDNKVLVLAYENQMKGNRLPYEYMMRDKTEEEYKEFEARVRVTYSNNTKKRDILLRKKLDETEWQTSALNDTRYISVTVKNLIEQHLKFDPRGTSKKKVYTYNGRMTDYVRKQWGIEKVRSDGDLHHAVDAAVIACMTEGMRHRIENYNKYRELYRHTHIINDEAFDPITGESLADHDRLQMPYPEFRKELVARTCDDVVEMRQDLMRLGYSEEESNATQLARVSRMPKRKMKGKLHEATLRSAKHIDEGIVVIRTSLSDLKLDGNNEIIGYYDKDHNKPLYELLKKKLIEAGGDAKKAFNDSVYKPRKDGSNGPIVHSVKTYIKSTSGVLLKKNGAFAKNPSTGSMCRVDVYTKGGKFYGVPIYVSDVYAGVLPMKAVSNSKSGWLDVNEDGLKFLFSLHKNDLIYVVSDGIGLDKSIKDPKSKLPNEISVKSGYLYFISFDVDGARITVESLDGSYKGRKSILNLKDFRKCEISVLGDISDVKSEKRQPLVTPRS